MSFDDEWARYQANAAQAAGQDTEGADPTRMQLNRAPVPPGTGGSGDAPDLAHIEEDKRKAASYIRSTLGPHVTQAGTKADYGSMGVAGGGTGPGIAHGALQGWGTQRGLSHCMTEWDRQVKALSGRLSSEASALSRTNSLFAGNEGLIGSRFLPSSGPDSPILRFVLGR